MAAVKAFTQYAGAKLSSLSLFLHIRHVCYTSKNQVAHLLKACMHVSSAFPPWFERIFTDLCSTVGWVEGEVNIAHNNIHPDGKREADPCDGIERWDLSQRRRFSRGKLWGKGWVAGSRWWAEESGNLQSYEECCHLWSPSCYSASRYCLLSAVPLKDTIRHR